MERFKEVICISINEDYPDQVKIGEHYLLDLYAIHNLGNGNWFANVYDMNKHVIGTMLITHFKEI